MIFITATVSNTSAFGAHSDVQQKEKFMSKLDLLFQHRTGPEKCTEQEQSAGFIKEELRPVETTGSVALCQGLKVNGYVRA